MLSCVSYGYAQDSFYNPNRFSYFIEFSTEYAENEKLDTIAKIEVTYDDKKGVSHYSISTKDSIMHQGRILDKQLFSDHQIFLLENYFGKNANAKLIIAKGGQLDNQKVAFVYYDNPEEDPKEEKTCHYMMLVDGLEQKMVKKTGSVTNCVGRCHIIHEETLPLQYER